MRRILLVVILMLCSSCSNSQRLSLPTFLKRANAVCQNSNARIEGIKSPDPTSDSAVADAINELLSIQKSEVHELSALHPPVSIEGNVQEWIHLLNQVLDETQQVAIATRRGDVGAARAADHAGTEPNKQANGIAKKLKLTACETKSTH